MARTKLVQRDPPEVIPRVKPRSRLPRALRFPILVTLSLSISSALWSLVFEFLGHELGAITKRETDITHVAARAAYRVGFLALLWYQGYDHVDAISLITLVSIPFAFLLSTFYNITTLTVAAYVNIEVVSMAFPIYLLRARSLLHRSNAPIRNRFLLDSFQVQASSALFATSVYVVFLWASLKTGVLTRYLITYFDIPTLEAAHAETVLSLSLKVFTAGLAARSFLVNPSISASSASGPGTPVEEFDPAEFDFTQQLKHSFWFFSRRTRTLIKQTAILSAVLVANVTFKASTLDGAEVKGIVGYGAAWAIANWVIAAWWVWIGNTDD